jgi:hypothetical protein
MRKNTVVSLAALFALLTFILSSCQKEWGCAVLSKTLLCTKGTDSIYVSTSISNYLSAPNYEYSQTYSQNIVNHYRQMGYTIDTVGYYGANELIYDVATVKAYEADGITCVENSYGQ